jgi:hypothetical protein
MLGAAPLTPGRRPVVDSTIVARRSWGAGR